MCIVNEYYALGCRHHITRIQLLESCAEGFDRISRTCNSGEIDVDATRPLYAEFLCTACYDDYTDSLSRTDLRIFIEGLLRNLHDQGKQVTFERQARHSHAGELAEFGALCEYIAQLNADMYNGGSRDDGDLTDLEPLEAGHDSSDEDYEDALEVPEGESDEPEARSTLFRWNSGQSECSSGDETHYEDALEVPEGETVSTLFRWNSGQSGRSSGDVTYDEMDLDSGFCE